MNVDHNLSNESNILFDIVQGKRFFYFVLGFAALELLSYLAWLSRGVAIGPISLATLIFLLACLAFAIVAWRQPLIGCYLVISEVIIGVHGYLLFGVFNGHQLSLRMALFIILLLVWLIKTPLTDKLAITKTKLWPLFILYFSLVVWGIIMAWVVGNSPTLILRNFQPWLLMLLLPVFITSLKLPEHFKTILQLILAGALVVAGQTIILAGVFAHWPNLAVTYIYPWLRLHLLAEVTMIAPNFFRFFSAGQIYVLIAWSLALIIFVYNFKKDSIRRDYWWAASLLIVYSSALLLSLSRSFWLGIIGVGLIFFFLVWRYFKFSWQNWLKLLAKLIAVLIIANFITLIFTNVLVLNPLAQNALNNRLQSSDSAASSRSAQLIPLIKAISNHPILGSGWGRTFTFKSSDPRILQQDPSGTYTAFVSEWGYLDFWLKLGLIGLLAFIFILLKIFQFFGQGLKLTDNIETKYLAAFCLLSLTGLVVTHLTSPYLNHPLGVMWLMLEAVFSLIWIKSYAAK